LLIAPGVVGESIAQVHTALVAEGAVARLVAPRIGPVTTQEGGVVEADASLENESGFLFDALVLPDGKAAVEVLAQDGHTMEFIKDQYRHCKTILVLGASAALLDQAGLPTTLPDGQPDAGLIISPSGNAADAAAAFIKGIAQHRHPQRETDPPRV
jgi:catalase